MSFWNWLKSLFTKKEETKLPDPQPEAPKAHAENPAYLEAKKYEGKGEKDKAFVVWLSSFWKLVKLPHYKTIVGSSFAWCALFVVAMQSEVGQKYIASAAANRQGATGVEIDWKKNGIPRGAVVQINHNLKCGSGSGNHVGFSDGDCTVDDLKSGTFNMMGGNQGDQVNVTSYSVREICYVRWPLEVPLPGKVVKSDGCKDKKKNSGSTR